MERKWTMQNVDLKLLSVKLGDFFKERDFEAVWEKTPTNYQITAANSPFFKLLGTVKAIIEGNPNDFSVKFELENRRRRYLGYGSMLLSMFGGGILVRQEALSDEAWFKLEKEFWPYTENLVLNLANTAKSSNDNES
jgi:hypothetical protein